LQVFTLGIYHLTFSLLSAAPGKFWWQRRASFPKGMLEEWGDVPSVAMSS
jgi:hypothetical protein